VTVWNIVSGLLPELQQPTYVTRCLSLLLIALL